ncbi:MAG TPA: SAM-dependent chlorinase/fluorinase [Acidimicrobiales bacterium]|nr:SAM-dependent chlorinase/fluorinase [Acidimicrobiales bacterium]
MRFDNVWFLSDYGLEDEFVGVVKAVVRAIAPHVTVGDVTHSIPAHDIRAGALALARSMQYLTLVPAVVLAVVDPGVGSGRRAVAVEAGGENGDGLDGPLSGPLGPRAILVGPDNGLLASAVAMAGGARRAVSLTNEEYHLPAPGPTFAGRDIFAPAAAHLCAGVDLAELGELVDPITLLPGIMPLSRQEDGAVTGEVLWVDRFGNIQLNVDPDDLLLMDDPLVLVSGDKTRKAVRARSYSDLRSGQIGLVTDSYGLVSIVLDRRSASEELRIGAGDSVTIKPAE